MFKELSQYLVQINNKAYKLCETKRWDSKRGTQYKKDLISAYTRYMDLLKELQ
jgi:hypothetical protein